MGEFRKMTDLEKNNKENRKKAKKSKNIANPIFCKSKINFSVGKGGIGLTCTIYTPDPN